MARLAFLGAARTVTGRSTCSRPRENASSSTRGCSRARRRCACSTGPSPQFDPRTVSALVLTHTHLDHIGRVPRLVKQGFSRPGLLHAADARARGDPPPGRRAPAGRGRRVPQPEEADEARAGAAALRPRGRRAGARALRAGAARGGARGRPRVRLLVPRGRPPPRRRLRRRDGAGGRRRRARPLQRRRRPLRRRPRQGPGPRAGRGLHRRREHVRQPHRTRTCRSSTSSRASSSAPSREEVSCSSRRSRWAVRSR